MNERLNLTPREQAWVEVARQTLEDADAPDLRAVGGAEFMVGRLRASLQSVLAIVDAQLSVERAFPKVADFLAEERERPVDPEVLAWHQGAIEGDPAVCGVPQPDQPAFPCIWNRSGHVEHRDLLGRTWRGGERP